jgi:hypothetical protein
MKMWYRILAMEPPAVKYHTVGTGTVLKQQIYDYENEEVCIKNICIILI